MFFWLLWQTFRENQRERQKDSKRSKLVLPAPQISDAELEEVVRIPGGWGASLEGVTATPGQMMTPLMGGAVGAPSSSIPSQTQLRAGLGSLPIPKNNFEIVIPEDKEGEMDLEEGSEVDSAYIEDAVEVDERRSKALREAGEIY